MWTDADRSRYRQAGNGLPSDLSDPEWDRLAPSDSGGEAGRTAAPDRHALGDERDLLSPANRLPVAVFAARGLSAALDRLQHLPRLPAGRSVGGDLGGAARGLARTAGREASPSAGVVDSCSLKSAETGDARKAKQTQWVTTPARVRPRARITYGGEDSIPESCRLVWKLTSGSVG